MPSANVTPVQPLRTCKVSSCSAGVPRPTVVKFGVCTVSVRAFCSESCQTSSCGSGHRGDETRSTAGCLRVRVTPVQQQIPFRNHTCFFLFFPFSLTRFLKRVKEIRRSGDREKRGEVGQRRQGNRRDKGQKGDKSAKGR